MSRSKVCFFIAGFDGGGAQKQCVYLINQLAADGVDVVLVHFQEGINYGLLDRRHVSVRRIRTSSFYDPRNIIRAVAVLKEERPDIVFSWLHACDVYTWFARLLYPKFKWVMAERDSWYPPDLRYWVRSAVGRRADMIVSNSAKGDLYWARRGVPDRCRKVIENLLPDAWFKARVAQPGVPQVCYAGRLEEQKNVVLLVDSFMELSKRREDVRFAVIGEGSLRGVLQERVEAGTGRGVSFLPFQPDIRPHFERTTVFVNISRHEGKPNTVIENLALGNRVVLSRIPEHIELVGESYPFLVDSSVSASELSLVIEHALACPVREEERGWLGGRLQAMRADRIAGRYAALFADLARIVHE